MQTKLNIVYKYPPCWVILTKDLLTELLPYLGNCYVENYNELTRIQYKVEQYNVYYAGWLFILCPRKSDTLYYVKTSLHNCSSTMFVTGRI